VHRAWRDVSAGAMREREAELRMDNATVYYLQRLTGMVFLHWRALSWSANWQLRRGAAATRGGAGGGAVPGRSMTEVFASSVAHHLPSLRSPDRPQRATLSPLRLHHRHAAETPPPEAGADGLPMYAGHASGSDEEQGRGTGSGSTSSSGSPPSGRRRLRLEAVSSPSPARAPAQATRFVRDGTFVSFQDFKLLQ
jgi:hypothetical protein